MRRHVWRSGVFWGFCSRTERSLPPSPLVHLLLPTRKRALRLASCRQSTRRGSFPPDWILFPDSVRRGEIYASDCRLWKSEMSFSLAGAAEGSGPPLRKRPFSFQWRLVSKSLVPRLRGSGAFQAALFFSETYELI